MRKLLWRASIQWRIQILQNMKLSLGKKKGGGGFSKNELLLQKTHPSVSQEDTHPEDTLGKIPLMLYRAFPFPQWLNNTLKHQLHPTPSFLGRGFVPISWPNWFWMSHTPVFLYGINLCVTTLKQMHHRELVWSPQTQTFKERQPMAFSGDSELLKQQSQ